jgi:hypothetical protein
MGRRGQEEKAEAWVEGQLGALPETDLRSTRGVQLRDERDGLRRREKRAKKMVQKVREAQNRASSTPVGLRRKREALESAIEATAERRREVSTELRQRPGAEDKIREALRRAERARRGLSRNERGEVKSLDEARRLFRGLSSAEQESFRARLDEDLVPILEEAADPERPSFEEVMEESAEEEISGQGGSSEPGQSDLGRESQGSQEEKGKDEDDSPDRGSPDRDRGRGRGRGGIGR